MNKWLARLMNLLLFPVSVILVLILLGLTLVIIVLAAIIFVVALTIIGVIVSVLFIILAFVSIFDPDIVKLYQFKQPEWTKEKIDQLVKKKK